MNASSRVARVVARELVAERAELMLRLLDARDPELRGRLRDAPVVELQTWGDVVVKYIDASHQSSDCSIAGAYIEASPPIIGIVEGSYSRREAFTALHELGHHLQRTNEDLIEALFDQPDNGRVLEEMTSDRFASAILIPSDLAESKLGLGTPSAIQVAELWRGSTASRAAVCVRAVQNLTSPGHVLLLDTDGRIEFATTYATFPLRRGLDQSATPIVRALQASSVSTVSGKTMWRYASGNLGDEQYAQATQLGNYILVVSVVDGAPWESLSLSAPKSRLTTTWHECAYCGHVAPRSETTLCPICQEPKCGADDCNRCSCASRVAELQCTQCWIIKPAHQFTRSPNVCDDCF